MPDAEAQKRSRSYLLPVADQEFLLRDEMRAARFGMEYLKAEFALRDWGVRSTVVVFGSARVPSRRGSARAGGPPHERTRRGDRRAARRADRRAASRSPAPLVLRGETAPQRIPAGGIVGIRDGDTVQETAILSPLAFAIEHRAEVPPPELVDEQQRPLGALRELIQPGDRHAQSGRLDAASLVMSVPSLQIGCGAAEAAAGRPPLR